MEIKNYTIIDVETASRRMPSICSLGLVHVSGGRVAARHHYYIKPPGRFEFWNIKVHGIEPYQVKAAPRFREIWPLIRDYCENSIIIAHNASFDLGQLKASLKEAGISHSDFYYIDTVKMAHRLFPEFPKYNLAYLSLVLDADLGDHHDALADASATGEIFENMQRAYPLQRSNISIYNSGKPKDYKKEDLKVFFDDLLVILQNLAPDEKLSESHQLELATWLQSTEELAESHPISELRPRVEFILRMDSYDEGVYWIINRLAMNYYHEKRSINIASSLREALELLKGEDKEGLSHWLEENFPLREEYLFDEVWRSLWEYSHHGQGDAQKLIEKLRSYIQPFDSYYSKEKLRSRTGILVGKLPPKYMKKFYNELNSVDARLEGLNPRKADFAIIVCGRKGLDYTPRVRKLLRLKEEGVDIKLYKIGRRL